MSDPLCEKRLVAQPAHQLGEGVGDPPDIPATLTRRSGKAIPRQRGRDHVDGVAGVAAVRCGVGQRLDNLVKLHDRPRPAVAEKERPRVRLRRLDVVVVDLLVVDCRRVLVEAVHPAFVPLEVVPGPPVLTDLLEPLPLGPVLPAGVRQLVGPPGALQALTEVRGRPLREVYLEGLDGRAHCLCSSPCSPCRHSA